MMNRQQSSQRVVIFPDNQTALACCRSLGPFGVPVDVLATDAASPGQYSRYARGIRCPEPREEESTFIDFLVRLGKQHTPPPLLFCTDDRSLMLCQKYRSELEHYFILVFPTQDCLRRVLLKDALYFQNVEGVPTPVSMRFKTEEDLKLVARRMAFPCLLKPTLRCLRDGGEINAAPFEQVFGEKAVRVHNRQELAKRFQQAKEHRFPVVIQEEIPGGIDRLYTLGIYAGRDGCIKAAWTARKLAQVPADFGDALIVEALPKPELLSLGERLVRSLGFYGIADIEFKQDPRDGEYKLLDINPRPWPWIGFPTVCGVNIPYAAYCDLTGLEVPVFHQTADRLHWVSVRGVLVSIVRSLRGERPFHELSRLLRHLRRVRFGSLFNHEDFLLQMFLSPRYWGAVTRHATGWIRNRSFIMEQG